MAWAGVFAPAVSEGSQALAKPRYTKSTELKGPCPILENSPMAGVPLRTWTKDSGRVGIRYNVDDRYALVLDYARASAKPEVNPHWGFIDRLCLKGQLHKGHLRATGGDGRDTRVPFSPRPDRTVGTRMARGNATLRSGAKSFAIGNLEAGDSFDITRHCSSQSSSSFVFGYAPVAQRWGWVQSSRLTGDPCAPRNYYHGFVSLGAEPVRDASQGAPWLLSFQESKPGPVEYKACVTHLDRPHVTRCYRRTSPASGARQDIFVAIFVNDRGGLGRWRAVWYVHGRRVASWRFMVHSEGV